MDKEALLKTMVTHWDENDNCFVTESPLDLLICGTGDTPEASVQSFHLHVEAHYEAYKQGKHARYNKPGRPAKGKTRFNTEIDPDVKAALTAAAKEIGISQGEMVEYLFKRYQASQ